MTSQYTTALMIERVRKIARESIEAKKAFFDSNAENVVSAAELLVTSIKAGGKVLIFGNGGSAAHAQHIAAELVNRLSDARPPIAAVPLTTDTSCLHPGAKDFSFVELFAPQLAA